jgi:hypothetical protein
MRNEAIRKSLDWIPGATSVAKTDFDCILAGHWSEHLFVDKSSAPVRVKCTISSSLDPDGRRNKQLILVYEIIAVHFKKERSCGIE